MTQNAMTAIGRRIRLRDHARSAWPLVGPLLVVALEWNLLSPTPALADHFQFWAAGRLAVIGLSPYDRGSWVTMAAYGPVPDGAAVNTVIGNLELTQYVWLYPPQTAFAFVPFGILPVAAGVYFLHVVLLAAALAALVLAGRAAGLAGVRLAVALSLAEISQPFVIGVRDGHPIGVILAGLVTAYVGVRDRRATWLALGVVLISLKPHIALAFGVGMLVYLVWRREWRLLSVAAIALAAVTVPAELVHPFPLASVISATGERADLDASSVGALSRDLGDGAVLTALIVATAGVAALVAGAARGPYQGAVAFGAVVALSLVVTPYAHDYDQLLILPAAFVGMSLARASRYGAALTSVFALLIAVVPTVLFFWYPLIGQEQRAYQAGMIGALPVITLIALAIGARGAAARTAPVPA